MLFSKDQRKTIGLRVQYFKYAILALLVTTVAMLCPVIMSEGKGYNILWLMSKSPLYMILCITLIVLLVLSIVFFVVPRKVLAYVYAGLSAVLTGSMTITVFATKRILDEQKALSKAFYVSDFGIVFWVGLVASFLTLIFALKMAKIHTGYIVLVIMSVIWLFPISWIVLTAFRAEPGYYVGYFIPKGFTFDNFINLFADTSVIHFGRWWLNTLFVAVCNCLTTTAIVLMTAFALSKTRFKGRMTMMKIMLIIGMFPGFMSMVAVYNILKGIGIAQTLWALVIVNAAGAAMGYYIVKGFFDTIPKSLDEAALLDGATKWQVFTKITIPMSKSVIIYTVLTSFMGPWGDYIFPSMMLGDNQSQYTVALGLKWLTDFRRIDAYYTQFAAGALLVSLPIVILFIALQRFYVEGMAGAVKG